jgi:Domain of unknown function (DUF1906)
MYSGISVRLPFRWLATAFAIAVACSNAFAQQAFRGFDRNDYPGDAALPALKKSFSFAGYWLNNPPGENRNSWVGKRALLKNQGFGFLVLFNGRMDAELKGKDAAAIGAADGKAAVAAAGKEGFARDVLIFLDQEEGGRLLTEQLAYIFAWANAVTQSGARAGVYCSGIDVAEGTSTISTAKHLVLEDEKRLKQSGAHRKALAIWVANDQCPPAPGCTETSKPASTGFSFQNSHAVVWQYAQSPQRKEFTARCPRNYDTDGNCYAPGLAHSATSFVDLNVADTADPSETP